MLISKWIQLHVDLCAHSWSLLLECSLHWFSGLAVDEQYVYWIDTDNGILHKSQKEGGESERLNINLEDVSYLQLVRRTYQLTSMYKAIWYVTHIYITGYWQTRLWLCIMPVLKTYALICVYLIGIYPDTNVHVLLGYRIKRSVLQVNSRLS